MKRHPFAVWLLALVCSVTVCDRASNAYPPWNGTGAANTWTAAQSSPQANPLWSVTDWYLGGSGVDSSSCGRAIGTPCATLSQITGPFWGFGQAVLAQNTILHVISGQTLNVERARLNVFMNGSFNLSIIGTPTVVQTLTPATLTAMNRSTPQLLAITVTSGQAALAAVGQIVVDTTRGSTSTVQAVAGTTITLAEPFTTLTSVNANRSLTPAEDNGWAVTDSLTFETRPLLNLTELAFNAPQTTPSGNSTGGVFYMQDILVPDQSGTSGRGTFAPYFTDTSLNFVDCQFNPVFSFIGPLSSATLQLRLVNNAFGTVATTNARYFGGYANLSMSGGEGFNTLDGDIIINSGTNNIFGGWTDVENVYLASGANLNPRGGVVRQTAGITGVSALWGPGSVALQPGTSWFNQDSRTYAQDFLITGSILFGATLTTGSKYSAGTWTSGITLSAANIDTNSGLQDPLTGARFATSNQ